ncbi:WAS/WASL-interacting protein family member 2, putative isoform 2 [Hibiscus syriacus]|uniref:WAS/WASL-interacting protein family member 2, putative isoform 2 n=1 Tax=Hibiscus syriacus TaxID=106335 RepID=A0A6A2YF64_HIBSY|nr:WAS/WASL-interacting protein family member 2, putative isoform 2 [Hibiscus syriacus]
MDDAEFWLPAEFLADDDGIMKKGNLKNENDGKTGTESWASSHGFPSELPYEFDSFGSVSALSSPVESVVESTETESSDEDEFLAGLTRRLAYSTSQKLTVATLSSDKNEKNGALASSPRSTLSGLAYLLSSSNNSPIGPSQVPSPSTTPFCAQNDTWDLIYTAAGQVARLRLSNEVPKYTNFSHGYMLKLLELEWRMFVLARDFRNRTTAFVGFFNGRQVKASNWQAQGRIRNNVVGGRPLGLPQSSWPPLQVQSQPKQLQSQNHPGSGMRPMFIHGSRGVKRECAGTGVFIPRCSTALLPAKVVQALNLNFPNTNNRHVQPRFDPGFASSYDALVARRNALLTQARRNYRQEGSLNLPQEWTY